jgi:hypothetical protein
MRKLAVFALLLTLLLGSGVLAQDLPPVFCGDLSEADCALLTDAQTAYTTMQSGTSTFEFDLALSGIPDLPFPLSLNLMGVGSFSGDMSALTSMANMANSGDMSAVYEQLPEIMDTVLTSTAADLALTLTLPEDLMAMMGPMMADVTGDDATPAKVPNVFSLQLRMVDGVGYVNLDQIANQLPTLGLPAGWLGLDFAELMRESLEMQPDMMPEDMPEIDSSMADMMTDPEMLASFITVERVEDSVIDGQTLAVFEYTIDFAGLMESEAYQSMLREQMLAAAEQSDENLSESDIEMALEVSSSALQGMTMSMRQAIGVDDKYMRAVSYEMTWDMTTVMEMADEMGEDMPAGTKPLLTMTMSATMDDINEPLTITAPEDATIIPLESLMPSESAGAVKNS